MMKINDIIKMFIFQFTDQCIQVPGVRMNVIDIGIATENGGKSFFCDVMYSCVLHLIFQASNYRCSKHDIADRTKANNKVFYHNIRIYRSWSQESN